MVACHNFDLDAAKKVGFKTAFVRRPNEWGVAGPPDPTPNPNHDIIVDTFTACRKAWRLESFTKNIKCLVRYLFVFSHGGTNKYP